MTKSQAYEMLMLCANAEELVGKVNTLIAKYGNILTGEIHQNSEVAFQHELMDFLAACLTDEPEEELDDNSTNNNPPTLST